MSVAELVHELTVSACLENHPQGGARRKYENFIGGRWVRTRQGKYFTDHSPINGAPIAEIAKSTPEDVEKALDAAHAARDAWGHTSPAARAEVLLKIANKMEENLELLALA